MPVTLWQEALALHRCQAALLQQQQSHSRQHAKQQLIAKACHLLRRVGSADTVSRNSQMSPACSEPDAPTFYFLVVTLPTDYYGPVEVAWSSAGSATDAEGNQLTPPQPLNFTRTQAEPLASSCVFELISPATQTA